MHTAYDKNKIYVLSNNNINVKLKLNLINNF